MSTKKTGDTEVIAENIYGPYRIEGSYMRGDKPEGFAVSLGQFTDNFATTVNLVVNYPSLESYVRFDGSVFLRDRTVTGNIIFESSKIADFLNEMTALDGVDASFNQPLAVTAAVATDKDRIDFSNVVVKYGRTSGAGNVEHDADRFAGVVDLYRAAVVGHVCRRSGLGAAKTIHAHI